MIFQLWIGTHSLIILLIIIDWLNIDWSSDWHRRIVAVYRLIIRGLIVVYWLDGLILSLILGWWYEDGRSGLSSPINHASAAKIAANSNSYYDYGCKDSGDG